jgi:hypothetical protein
MRYDDVASMAIDPFLGCMGYMSGYKKLDLGYLAIEDQLSS